MSTHNPSRINPVLATLRRGFSHSASVALPLVCATVFLAQNAASETLETTPDNTVLSNTAGEAAGALYTGLLSQPYDELAAEGQGGGPIYDITLSNTFTDPVIGTANPTQVKQLALIANLGAVVNTGTRLNKSSDKYLHNLTVMGADITVNSLYTGSVETVHSALLVRDSHVAIIGEADFGDNGPMKITLDGKNVTVSAVSNESIATYGFYGPDGELHVRDSAKQSGKGKMANSVLITAQSHGVEAAAVRIENYGTQMEVSDLTLKGTMTGVGNAYGLYTLRDWSRTSTPTDIYAEKVTISAVNTGANAATGPTSDAYGIRTDNTTQIGKSFSCIKCVSPVVAISSESVNGAAYGVATTAWTTFSRVGSLTVSALTEKGSAIGVYVTEGPTNEEILDVLSYGDITIEAKANGAATGGLYGVSTEALGPKDDEYLDVEAVATGTLSIRAVSTLEAAGGATPSFTAAAFRKNGGGTHLVGESILIEADVAETSGAVSAFEVVSGASDNLHTHQLTLKAQADKALSVTGLAVANQDEGASWVVRGPDDEDWVLEATSPFSAPAITVTAQAAEAETVTGVLLDKTATVHFGAHGVGIDAQQLQGVVITASAENATGVVSGVNSQAKLFAVDNSITGELPENAKPGIQVSATAANAAALYGAYLGSSTESDSSKALFISPSDISFSSTVTGAAEVAGALSGYAASTLEVESTAGDVTFTTLAEEGVTQSFALKTDYSTNGSATITAKGGSLTIENTNKTTAAPSDRADARFAGGRALIGLGGALTVAVGSDITIQNTGTSVSGQGQGALDWRSNEALKLTAESGSILIDNKNTISGLAAEVAEGDFSGGRALYGLSQKDAILTAKNVTIQNTGTSAEGQMQSAIDWRSDAMLSVTATEALTIENTASVQGALEENTEALRSAAVINAGNSDVWLDAPSIQISSSGDTAEGFSQAAVYNSGSGQIRLENGAIAVAATENNATGTVRALYSTNGTIALDNPVSVDLKAAGGSNPVAIHAAESLVSLQGLVDGTISISAEDSTQAAGVAVFAENRSSVTLDGLHSTTFTIHGDLVAENASDIFIDANEQLTLTGSLFAYDLQTPEENVSPSSITVQALQNAVFTGSADDFTDEGTESRKARLLALYQKLHETDTASLDTLASGSISLDLGSNSLWNVTANSQLQSLTMQNSTIDLGYGAADGEFRRVGIQNFQGENNTIKMRIDLAAESEGNAATDQLVLGSASEAIQNVEVRVLTDATSPSKSISANYLIQYLSGASDEEAPEAGSVQMRSAAVAAAPGTLTVVPTVLNPNGSTSSWVLAYAEDPSTLANLESVEGVTTAGQNGYWHLVREKTAEVEEAAKVDPRVDNPEVQTMKNIGTSYGEYLGWRSDLTDLRHRLGEVRLGAESGAWVKGVYERERGSTTGVNGFKQNTYGVQIGADKAYKRENGDEYLLGAAFKVARSTRKHDSAAENGLGDMNQYSAKLYGTYLWQNGTYVDSIVYLGLFDQDLKGANNQMDALATSSYKTYGYGASVEAGRQIRFKESADNGFWFVEPQAQIALYRIHGKDFTSSTGMEVSQKNVTSVLGRVGLEAGQKLPSKSAETGFQWNARVGFKHEFAGSQKVVLNNDYQFKAHLGGTSFYYGVEADWKVAKDKRFFINVDRETGNNYRKDVAVRAGFRYTF